MRILSISVATILTVAALLTMARIWGLGQSFATYDHSFFNTETPYLIVKATTLTEAEEVLKAKPSAILWLDVRFSREKTVFVLPAALDQKLLNAKTEQQNKNPTEQILIGGHLSEYPFSITHEFYKNVSPLKDFYEKFPQTRFILNIVDNVSDAHTTLINVVRDLKPDQRTLIQSDALILMTSVRELKAEWVYGTSIPDIMRLLTFDSIYITPSIVFKGDVFIAAFTLMKRPTFNDDIVAEMRRRQKRIFLGPIRNTEELAIATRYHAEGYIFENLADLYSVLGQGPAQ